MKKAIPAIILFSILLLGLLGYFLYNNQSQPEEENYNPAKGYGQAIQTAKENKAQLEAEQEAEAQRMIEEKNQRQEEERRWQLAELNERLAQEAKEREMAEKQLEELNKKMAAMQEAQEEAKEKVKALEEARAENTEDPKVEELLASLQQKNKEMQRLAEQQQALEQQRSAALQRQIEMEEKIIDSGGTIQIPGYEIRSINYKRREHLYLKKRVSEMDKAD